MTPPAFAVGQHIHYVSGSDVQAGTFMSIRWEQGRTMAHGRWKVTLRRTGDDLKPSERVPITITLQRVIAGEAIRCRQEAARCAADIPTDIGALVGSADWRKELEILEGEKVRTA